MNKRISKMVIKKEMDIFVTAAISAWKNDFLCGFDAKEAMKEKAILELASRSRQPEFVAVYGRRHVGKTHPVRDFFGVRSVSRLSENMASP
jgi:hypothetical protein